MVAASQRKGIDMMKFNNVFCSQCGEDFGPGDHGFSDCRAHRMQAIKIRRLLKNAKRMCDQGNYIGVATMLATKITYLQDELNAFIVRDADLSDATECFSQWDKEQQKQKMTRKSEAV